VVDRCYLHGTSTGNTGAGIYAASSRVGLVDSYLSEIHTLSSPESHGIQIMYGPGPHKIENNYIAAGQINIFLG
ncbi:MAG: hypothetical protein AAB728_04530, partial [Patescibacteria group bacterium]